MKLRPNISSGRRLSGVLLIECLVYIGVFAILLGLGTAAFYFCWDHTRAVLITANEVESALRTGELWRADVRAAKGKIALETTAAGEVVRFHQGANEVIYRFDGSQLWREIKSLNQSRLLLEKVKASEMKSDTRGDVTAWHWELELTPRRKETHFPLLFTFEAVQPKP